MVRGFAGDYAHAREFSAFAAALHLKPFLDTGESAAPRTRLAPHVYTANEAPPSASIPFHHEMAQSACPPRFVLFFCQKPSLLGGGRTPLVSSRDVAIHVRTHHKYASDQLVERGVRYVRTLPLETDSTSPIGKSWKVAFDCSSTSEAERIMKQRGFDWSWLSDGSLKTTTPKCSVFGQDHLGRETFFNSIIGARTGWNDRRNRGEQTVVFADDKTPLDKATGLLFEDAATFMHHNAVRREWHRGDILIIDNLQMLHAREPFASKDRRVLASLWGERR
jgi:hypothetical protein